MEPGQPGPYAPAWEAQEPQAPEAGQGAWPPQAQGHDAWLSGPGRPLRPYQPLGGLTDWAVGLAVAYALAAVLGVLLNVIPYGLAFALLLAPVTWGAIIVSVIWCFRASANAHALRGGLRWQPGWAAGAWFIPLAHVVMPALIMAEVWRASRPTSGDWSRTPLPTLFATWWGLWVAGAVVSGVAGALLFVDSFRTASSAGAAAGGPGGFFAPAFVPGDPAFWISLIQPFLLLAALPLWLRVVRSIDEGQQVLASHAGVPPPPGQGPSAWAPEETGHQHI